MHGKKPSIGVSQLDNHRFSDQWHKNDTFYRLREVPVEAIMQIMTQLPDPDNRINPDFVKAECLDPARGTYLIIFRRTPNHEGRYRWFFYQCEFHPK